MKREYKLINSTLNVCTIKSDGIVIDWFHDGIDWQI